MKTLKNVIEQVKIRKFKIKYIQEYEGDYFDGHKNNNLMLNYINPNTYFLSYAGDRVLMETKNWDKILADNKILEMTFMVKYQISETGSILIIGSVVLHLKMFFITKKL